MTNIIRQRVLSTLALAVLAACGQSQGRKLHDDEARDILSANWRGDLAHVSPPGVYELEAQSLSDVGQQLQGDDLDDESTVETDDVIAFSAKTGKYYRVEAGSIDPEIARVVAARDQRQLTAARADLVDLAYDPILQGPDVDKAVIGPSDTRVPFSIAGGYTKDDWVATIGMVTLQNDATKPGCTGTLVSSDIVLTAAHCVVANDGNFRPSGFAPRMDGSGTASGKMPWGHWTTVVNKYIAAGFVSNNCHTTPTSTCTRYDWALIRYTRPAAAQGLNLYMRLQNMAPAAFSGVLKNRGYPDCSAPMAPASCQQFTLFGDNNYCGVTNDGYTDRMTHTCDTNDGHSGSPLYSYVNGYPTISGIVSRSTQAGNPAVWTNWLRPMTQLMIDKIGTFQ